MVQHRLKPLLNPISVAVVGASPKEDSFGWKSYRGVVNIGYDGDVHLVNPRYNEIDDRPCSPDITAVGRPVERAMLNVANARLEGVLDDAIANGVKAMTIFASCYLKGDTDPPLLDRLRTKARAAGLQVCGGIGSGFVNRDEKTQIALGRHTQQHRIQRHHADLAIGLDLRRPHPDQRPAHV